MPKKTRFIAIGTIAALVAMLSLGAATVSAVTTPIIEGDVRGIELCAQYRCGAAIFAGRFDGNVGQVHDPNGVWGVAVKHNPLPEPGDSTDITGGVFSLDAAGKTIKGIARGGTLTNNGDDTFNIHVTLILTRGGVGTLTFDGVLDHTRVGTRFPLVTVTGTISQ